MELSDLKKIGLTGGEIKVYSALLELGETTRTELAKKSGISPSKIYDVANRLIVKGIIASVKKNGITHFSAANPERIKDFIQNKEKDLIKEKEIVERILPILLGKYTQTKEHTDVEVFYGWEGMKTIFDDKVKEMKKGESDYIFGASRGYDSKQADIFFSQYYLKKRDKGFGSKIIFNEDVRTNIRRTSIFREDPNEIRFLNQETFTEINLYHNTVLVIMLLKKPLVIRVRNKDAATSFRQYFESMWKIAEK